MHEISSAQREKLDTLRRHYGIRLILAFGSRIRGNSHSESDLDLGLLFSASDFNRRVYEELSEIFPGENVDVAVLNRADPLLLKEVSDNCMLLSGDVADLQTFRMYAFKRYVDHAPYFALEAATNQRHLAELRTWRSIGSFISPQRRSASLPRTTRNPSWS